MVPFAFHNYQFEQNYVYLNVVIADMTLQLCAVNKNVLNAIEQQYRKFRSRKESYDIRLDIHLADGIYFPHPDGTDQFYTVHHFDNDRCYIQSNFFTGFVDTNDNYGKLIIDEQNPLAWLEHFLRIAFALTALPQNAMLFHGAGIIDNGQGYIFFGPSGAGKTTVTQFSKPRVVLGDDMLVLRESNGTIKVHATPFNSETNGFRLTNGSASIAGCFRLIQDKTTFIKQLSWGKAMAELLANIPPLNKNNNDCQLAMTFCMDLIDRVPSFELHFTKDNSFWRIIHGIF